MFVKQEEAKTNLDYTDSSVFLRVTRVSSFVARIKQKPTYDTIPNWVKDSLFSISCSGSLFHNLYVESLALTSATFVTAANNLIPAITFIIAITIGYISNFLQLKSRFAHRFFINVKILLRILKSYFFTLYFLKWEQIDL